MKKNALIKLVLPVLLILCSIGWAIQCHAQGTLFVPASGSPVIVGQGSGEVFLADLNGDGHLDLLTKHLLTQRVAIQLGDGKGHFASAAENSMSFTYQPGALTLSDVNNDTILDLGIASREGDKEYVRIFLGNGKGAFSLASGSPFTTSASQETYKPILCFGDINEDGKMDLVTGNGRRNSIEVFFGDGRGSFSIRPIVKLEATQSRHSFVLGDVDGDRHLDVVIAINNESEGARGRLIIKRGDGKGAFNDATESSLSLPSGPRLGMLADVNGDRYLDIVLSHSSSHLSVLLNRGNGMFSPAPGSPYTIGTEAFGVVVADVNQDKKNDLVAATVNSVTVLLGDRGGFVPAPGSPFDAGPGAYNVTVGDLNEDGKLDVAASSFEGKAVTVLLRR
jgi:hypothetical protein